MKDTSDGRPFSSSRPLLFSSFGHEKLTDTVTELRETALHCPEDLVCRSRYSRRHRIHHRPHQLQRRAALAIDRPRPARDHLHDNAEAAPLPIPRPHRRVPGSRWRGPNRNRAVHCARARLHRQAAVRDDGIWFAGGHVGVRVHVAARSGPRGCHCSLR